MNSPPPPRSSRSDEPAVTSHALQEAQTLLEGMTGTTGRLAQLPSRAFLPACVVCGLVAAALLVRDFDAGLLPPRRAPHLIDLTALGALAAAAWGLWAAWRDRVTLRVRQALALCTLAFYTAALSVADLQAMLFISALVVFLHLTVPRAQALAGTLLLAAATVAVPWAWRLPLEWDLLLPLGITAGLTAAMMQYVAGQAAGLRRAMSRDTRRLQDLTQSMAEDMDRMHLARSRAETALAAHRASQARADELGVLLEGTIANLAQGLIVVGPDQRVRLHNEQACRLLDLPRAQLEGQPLFTELVRFQRERGDFGPGLSRLDDTMRALVQALPERLAEQLPPRYMRELDDGRRIEVVNQAIPSGHVVHTYTDVTAYVRANEQLQQSLAQLRQVERSLKTDLARSREDVDMNSRFVAAVSHEIRTSLNGITGMTDLLQHSSLSSEQLSMVRDMRSSAKQLRRLTDDILDLARLQDPQFRLECTPFALHRQLTLCVQAAQASARSKGLKLVLDLDCPDVVLEGDPQRLNQVLNNLIYNAIKFTERGAVRVTARVVETADAQAPVDVFLTVADTGRGIEPAMLEHIFEPFHQGAESTNRDFGGTGLGLALCRQLCEAMGGQISVSSQTGAGSVFNVHLPLPRSSAANAWYDTVPSEAAADSETAALRGRRVLVVDDNRINRRLVCAWLDAVGAPTVTAVDGGEGLSRAAEHDFDCVLMDMSMPVMNGLDAARAIRSLSGDPDSERRRRSRVPIIGVTAMARPQDREVCLKAGMNAHVGKPLEREVLLRVIKQAIDASVWLEASASGWQSLDDGSTRAALKF